TGPQMGATHPPKAETFGRLLAHDIRGEMIAFTNIRLVLVGFVAGAVLGGTTTVLLKRHNSPAETVAPAPAFLPVSRPLHEYGEPISSSAVQSPVVQAPVIQNPVIQRPVDAQPMYTAYVAPAPVRAPVHRRVVRKRRSTRKSVAIVAGTAGVGAAIGAIAGG